MNSSQTGINTSPSEVTDITLSGFWLLVENREYFVPFSEYPMFLNASVANIYGCRQISPGQFSWPALDIDIELAALNNPDQFPLAFKP